MTRCCYLFAAASAVVVACGGPPFTAIEPEDIARGGADSAGGSQSLTVQNGGAMAQGGAAPLGGASAHGGAAGSPPEDTGAGAPGDDEPPDCSAAGGDCSATPRACRDLPSGSPSGEYPIDPDGTGPLPKFTASCDLDGDGGGWTLILNYLHRGGTNPALEVRPDSLPLLGASELGTDESASVNWGHAAAKLVAALEPSALRFRAKMAGSAQAIDFTTSDAGCISYASGANLSCKGIAANSIPSSAHAALLPRAAVNFMSGKGDLALTEFPFYAGGLAHWSVRGAGQRWEVDNTPITGKSSAAADTLHRIWAR